MPRGGYAAFVVGRFLSCRRCSWVGGGSQGAVRRALAVLAVCSVASDGFTPSILGLDAGVVTGWAPLSKVPVSGNTQAIGICCGRIGYWHRFGGNDNQE